jgi:HEAT repeat protein
MLVGYIGCYLLPLAACLLLSPPAAEEIVDAPMYRDPDLPEPTVIVDHVDAKALWLKALARPEAEPPCRTAEAVALAQRRGVKGLEVMVTPLRTALDRPDQHPAVRLAAAQALIALEARATAPSLWEQARAGGPELREVVEPALAEWDYRPARAAWLARLRGPGVAQRDLVLAVRVLAAVREEQAAEPLRELVLSDGVPGPVRLEAAGALGTLRREGLEEDAERLADADPSRGPGTRLAAATLLQRHRGERAVRLLQRLARDDEPTVAARAAARLIALDPKLLLPDLERLLTRPDATVRSLAVEVLRREPTIPRIRSLGDRLDDPHPDVRAQARRALRELARRKEFLESVLRGGTRLLAAESWRGQEQAAALLVQLDHKPASGRLVELLHSPRPEVFVTAAWGLRRLAVPETLPAVVRYLETGLRRQRAAAEFPDAAYDWYDHQLSQLNQFVGIQKYGPADAILRGFVPRMARGMSPECRAAAIWALGLIHEGKPDPSLVTAVEMRLNDEPPMIPSEDLRVRRMAAITLARLDAKQTLPSLRRSFPAGKPSLDPVNNACGWAIEQLTGERMPAPTPIRKLQSDGFLTPLAGP